jgi:septum site-determining protein MinC
MSAPEPAIPPLHLRVRYDDSVPVLLVPDDLPFAELREWMRSRLPEALPEIGGRASRLHLGSRPIQLFDVRRLVHMLRDEFNVEITGLYVQPKAIVRYAERELKLKLFQLGEVSPFGEPEAPEDDPADVPMPGLADLVAALASDEEDEDEAVDEEPEEPTEEELEPEMFEPLPAQRRDIPLPDLPDEEPDSDPDGGRPALTVTRTLRSGVRIRYDGDVVIYGDVNAGAEVKAAGNILVLGRLRGVVHAGANGDEGAHILAFEMAPTQLRVARQIAIAPAGARSKDLFAPEIATIVDGGIVIEPYRGRLRR